MRAPTAKIVGGLCAAIVVSCSTHARAEYVENGMALHSAALTLAIGGTAAVAFDVASVVYLAGGQGDQAGRIVSGVGSIAAGISIIVPSALLLAVAFGEGYIPPGGGSEEDAMHTGRAIAGIFAPVNASSSDCGSQSELRIADCQQQG